VRSLADQGHAVIYVTHRLGEVFEIADRVTVFRNGASQPPAQVSALTMDSLIERILGRPLEAMFPPKAQAFGEPTLVVEGLETEGLAEPVGVQVRAGEILGLGGQVGSGAECLLRAVAGAQPSTGGRVFVAAKELRAHSRHGSIEAGVSYCSDDRKHDGLFAGMTVTQNFTSVSLDRVTRAGVVSRRSESRLARELAGFFQVDPRRLSHRAATLSGGNQQKVALGKWLGTQPRVLLVEEPTRGVDVGARSEIYSHLRRLAEQGLAIAFSSSDLPEVLGLADTVATFSRGRLVRVAPASGLTTTDVLRDVTHDVKTTRATT
jgi:ABC-type sugar transport system ATPase subunit